MMNREVRQIPKNTSHTIRKRLTGTAFKQYCLSEFWDCANSPTGRCLEETIYLPLLEICSSSFSSFLTSSPFPPKQL